MSSKYHGDNRPVQTKGVPLEIIVTNTKRKSQHKSPCLMPEDCIDMDQPTFEKAYGPHIVQAVFDLLQHKAFRQGLEDNKLIVAP